MSKQHLFTPGPTPIPDKVIQKMSEPIIYHRSSEFREMFEKVNANLKYIFQTKQPVLTLLSSGTGGMEATFVNLFSLGDTIISVNNGKFGARWVSMPRAFGLNVIEIKVEWGMAPTSEEVLNALKQYPHAKAVYLVHCETSTGTATDVKFLAKIIRENSSALVCVDGVSSIGALEFRFDEWGIDACVTCSQKGLMLPPGLAFVALSARALKTMNQSKMPKYYFDLRKALNALEKNDTPWTPAISIIMGAAASLNMIREEEIENVWRRHQQIGRALRAGIKAIGLELLSHYPSDSVTAVWLPPNIDWTLFNNILQEKYQITIAPGQEEYYEKIFRIAHVGDINVLDGQSVISTLEQTLLKCGMVFEIGAGLREYECNMDK